MEFDKLLSKLSKNLLNNEYCDITIEVGNDPYAKIFHAHMVILNYRCPYLLRFLPTDKGNNDGKLVNIIRKTTRNYSSMLRVQCRRKRIEEKNI